MKIFKWYILFVLLLVVLQTKGQTVLFTEDFDSYSYNTTQGSGSPAKWTIDHHQYANDRTSSYFMAVDDKGRFKVQNLGNTEAGAISYLRVKDINISSYDNVKVSVRIPPSIGNLESGTDYMYLKISTNGGSSDQLYGWITGPVNEETSISVSGLTGSTLQVRVAFSNSGSDEVFFCDDIEIIGYNNYPTSWLKANGNLTVRSDNGISWWPDEALGSGLSTTDTNNSGPHFTENAFNFNPSARFDGNDRAYRSISNSLINSTDNTCLIVQRFESGQVIFAMGQQDMSNDRRFNFVASSNNPRFDFPNHSTTDGRLVGTQSMVNQLRIYTLYSDDSQNRIYFNGNLHASKNRTSTLTNGQGSYSMYMGSNIQSGNHSTTQVAEMIFFNSNLDDDALNSWYSYLGLKYGITIGNNGSSFIYLDAEENQIWDGQTTYQNDVAGLAANGTWELYQSVSSSSNTSASTGANITMATNDDFTSPNEDTDRTKLNDGQYLIWGHNNANYSSWSTVGNYKKVNRYWKVQNTGNVGQVDFQINLSGFPSNTDYYRVIVDDDTDISNGITASYILNQSSGSLYSTSINFPSGTSYFTIGESSLPSIGLWLKAETLGDIYEDYDNIITWPDQSGNGNNAFQSTSSKRPLLVGGINKSVWFSNTFLDIPYSSTLNPASFTYFLVTRAYNQSGYSSPITSRDDSPSKGYILYVKDGTFQFWSGGGAYTGNWKNFSTGITTQDSRFELITFKGSASGNNIVKRFYQNGTMVSSTPTHSYSPNTQRPTRIGAGASETTNGNYFFGGYIAEIIMYPSPLGDTDRNKVESYLAVKYGFTLGHNYLSSSGATTYYVNTYNNDITGLGRDSDLGLDARYSTSGDYSPSLSMGYALSTNNNFDTSSEEPRTQLSNGQYVIMGHNDGSYNSWISEGDYNRIGRRWKVRNTGNTDTIYIRFYMNNVVIPVGSRKIAVDSDENLANGITAIHPIKNIQGDYYYAAVPFPSGSTYFTIIDDESAEQQLWLRANSGTSSTTDEALVQNWSDQSGNNITASQSASASRPSYEVDGINFNPVLEFDGSNDFMQIFSNTTFGYGNGSRATFLVAKESSSSGTWRFAWSYGRGSTKQAWCIGKNGSGKSIVVGSWSHDIITGAWGDLPRLITGEHDGDNMKLYQEGGSPTLKAGTINTDTWVTHIGCQVNRNENWQGQIAEIMQYSGELTNAERNQIQSYLALKYGISLNHNYVSTAGTTLFDISSYSTDIAGIGKDTAFSLDQKVSSSSNTTSSDGSDITIANNNDFTSSNLDSDRTSLTNNQYLIWGHNNGNTSSWTTSGDYRHVARRWRIQNTGNIGNIHFQINLNGYPAPYASYYLIIDNDTNISNGITQTVKLSNSSGDLYTANFSFPSGTNYFTIGHSTGEQNVFWFKADAGTSSSSDNASLSSWNDQSDESNHLSQSSSTNQASLQTNEFNFNPIVRFDGSSDYFSFSSNSNLGYSTTPRTSFVVAKDDGADTDQRFVFSYGNGSTSQSWGIKRNSSSTDISLVTYSNNLDGDDWGSAIRLITGSYDGSALRLSVEGNTASSSSTSINTSSNVSYVGRHVDSNINYWDGDIAEIIHFVGNLPDSEKNKIESYLSLKYGITLAHNYTNSSGSTIYTISTYNNHIAGLGRDTDLELDQKVSSSSLTSSSTSSDITMATSNDFTAANQDAGRTSLTNGQYLIWGHNNAATTTWNISGDYKHVSRRWKVENTGNVGAVHFQINLNSYPSAVGSYYLLVDSDTDLSNGVSNTYELSGSGNLYTANPTFGNGISYFTIGYDYGDVDYGDAPNSYSTLQANNGPIHTVVSGTYLGSGVSLDADGFRNGTDANSNASDDTNDDGVTFNPALNISSVNILEAGVSNTLRINASVNGYISAWVDLNLDGDFADSGEKLIDNSSVSSGNNDLTFTLNNTNKHGVTYARIRFYTSDAEVSSYTGTASDGEVEDYQVHITADKPSDICDNLLSNGGFELPDVPGGNYSFNKSQVPGWNSSVNKVEIWNTGSVSGIASQEGIQLSELNVSGATTYFQDVVTNPGDIMVWQIYHRGRSGTDQINFKLGAPGNTSSVQNISTGTSWTRYSGEYTVPAGQYITRFEILTVSPTNGTGNLLDNIYFKVKDSTNPVITANEQSVTVNNANCTYLVSGTALDATATDNCSISTLTHNYDGGGSSLDGKSFPMDTTDVSWTATDINGNSVSQVMQVIVSTDLAVTLSGPENNSSCSGSNAIFTASASGGTPNYTYTFYVNNIEITNGVSDNTFTSSGLSNGDVIKVQVSDNYSCTGESTEITIIIFTAPSPTLYHE